MKGNFVLLILCCFSRLLNAASAELKEMKGDFFEKALSEKQKLLVSKFIEKEIENRSENPFEYSLRK